MINTVITIICHELYNIVKKFRHTTYNIPSKEIAVLTYKSRNNSCICIIYHASPIKDLLEVMKHSYQILLSNSKEEHQEL